MDAAGKLRRHAGAGTGLRAGRRPAARRQARAAGAGARPGREGARPIRRRDAESLGRGEGRGAGRRCCSSIRSTTARSACHPRRARLGRGRHRRRAYRARPRRGGLRGRPEIRPGGQIYSDRTAIRSARTACTCRKRRSSPASSSSRPTTPSSSCCASAACCSRSRKSRTAIRIAGGIARRSRSAPRRSGSSAWSRRACAPMRSKRSAMTSTGIRPGARSASPA